MSDRIGLVRPERRAAIRVAADQGAGAAVMRMHKIQRDNPAAYKVLSDLIADRLNGNTVYNGMSFSGNTLDERIQSVIDLYASKGKNLTYDEAFDELIADAVPVLLADEATVRDLVRLDRTLAERIHDFFEGFYNSLLEATAKLAYGDANKLEFQALANDLDAVKSIADMFKAALEGSTYSTGITFDSGTKYSTKAQKTIDGYMEAVDDLVRSRAEMYRNDKGAKDQRTFITKASDALAERINSITGIDVAGFSIFADKTAFNHIERRHGVNGEQDHSMADLNDVARMGFVIDRFDDVSPLYDENGNQKYSARFADANNNPAPLILISKKINGTYYISEAVADSKNKRIWVESARINKKGVMQVATARGHAITSET
ncbi:MAG: hypothetical protein Q4C13_07140, partial [Clostridia bacterium]|nr:hypothetical protein [Clostridia bacterium]